MSSIDDRTSLGPRAKPRHAAGVRALTGRRTRKLYGLPDLDPVRFEVAVRKPRRIGVRGRSPGSVGPVPGAGAEELPPPLSPLAQEHQVLETWDEPPAYADLDRLLAETETMTRRVAMLLERQKLPQP